MKPEEAAAINAEFETINARWKAEHEALIAKYTDAIVDPPVDPPPTPTDALLVRELVDLTRVVAFDKQLSAGARYERFQRHLSIKTTTSTHKINCDDQAAGGLAIPFPLPRYGIELSKLNDNKTLGPAVERGSFTPAAGAKTANVTITLGGETDGWYPSEIVGYDAAGVRVPGSGMKFWLVIDRDGLAKDSPWTIRQSGNFDWPHNSAMFAQKKGWYSYIVYPKESVAPQPRPLPERFTVTPFGTHLPSSSLARVALVPGPDPNDQNTHYPCETIDGVLVGDNQQGYEPYHMFKAIPQLPDVDGPRGVCTAPFPLALHGARDGQIYALTPHSLCKITSTGAKRTLHGITAAGRPWYWEHAPTTVTDQRVKMIGSADESIPVEERKPHEPWALAIDPRSVLLDEAAEPIGGEFPHLPYVAENDDLIDGPRMFYPDSLDRLVELQFSGSNRGAPPHMRVRLKLPGGDPWGAAIDGRRLYIGLRKQNKIVEVDIETWQTIREVVSSPGASVVGSIQPLPKRRFKWNPGQSIDTARAHACVAPEGMAFMNIAGRRWLYVAALAKAEVERIDLDTGERQHVCFPKVAISGSGVDSYFLQIAVSDGSFGEIGTVFVNSFWNGPFNGLPAAFKPDGTAWDYYNFNAGTGYGVQQASAPPWSAMGYALGVAVHQGRLFFADANGSINYICKADDYDVKVDKAKARAGQEAYVANGHSVEHGPYLCNRTTKSLPWGEDANTDYWMTNVLRAAP